MEMGLLSVCAILFKKKLLFNVLRYYSIVKTAFLGGGSFSLEFLGRL